MVAHVFSFCTMHVMHCPPRPFRPVLRLKNCANDNCSQLPTRKSESLSCSAEWISVEFLGHPPAADVHIYTSDTCLKMSNLRGS